MEAKLTINISCRCNCSLKTMRISWETLIFACTDSVPLYFCPINTTLSCHISQQISPNYRPSAAHKKTYQLPTPKQKWGMSSNLPRNGRNVEERQFDGRCFCFISWRCWWKIWTFIVNVQWKDVSLILGQKLICYLMVEMKKYRWIEIEFVGKLWKQRKTSFCCKVFKWWTI